MAIAHETVAQKDNDVRRGYVQQVSVVDTALASGASLGLVVKTSDYPFDVAFAVAAGATGRVRIYEDPVVTSCTLTAACNTNRHKAGLASVAASFGSAPVFATASASLLFDRVTTRVSAAGTQAVTDVDWILADNTTYIIAVHNLANAASAFSVAARCVFRT